MQVGLSSDPEFLQTALIVVFQVVAIAAGLIGGLKYLDHRNDDKIKAEVEKQIAPFNLEMERIKACLKLQQQEYVNAFQKAEMATKYVEKAIIRLQTLTDDMEANEYRLRRRDKYQDSRDSE